jgi:hypothetical protein
MMNKIKITILLLGSFNAIFGQNKTQDSKKRLNFAKTYFEIGSNIYPSFKGAALNSSGELVHSSNPVSVAPILNIGGYHFWGHGDFYISIPLASLSKTNLENQKISLNESVVTGLRYLPKAFRPKQLTPVVGAAWIVSNFKQSNNGDSNPIFTENALRLDGGLLYGNSTWQIRGGINYYFKNNRNYPIDKTHFQKIKTPPFSANIGLVYAFETTSKGINKTEMDRLNSITDFSNPVETHSPKGDWFVGIGASSAFILTKSGYNQSKNPYFNAKSISKTYFDWALGYHFNHARLVTNLSFRRIPYQEKAFGEKQKLVKQSLLTEGFYYLTDYNGFTPFLGINLGYDKITMNQNETNLVSKRQITTGITLGWDILPNKTEQPFVLRTNLRWFPFQQVEVDGVKHSLHQLEYNVIQAVWYPGRKKK